MFGIAISFYGVFCNLEGCIYLVGDLGKTAILDVCFGCSHPISCKDAQAAASENREWETENRKERAKIHQYCCWDRWNTATIVGILENINWLAEFLPSTAVSPSEILWETHSAWIIQWCFPTTCAWCFWWIDVQGLLYVITPARFNSSPLKNDSWKTSLSFWGPVKFHGRTVKLPGNKC